MVRAFVLSKSEKSNIMSLLEGPDRGSSIIQAEQQAFREKCKVGVKAVH